MPLKALPGKKRIKPFRPAGLVHILFNIYWYYSRDNILRKYTLIVKRHYRDQKDQRGDLDVTN